MRFFINPELRIVRTLDDGEKRRFKLREGGDGEWLETDEAGYDQFSADTKRMFSAKQAKLIRHRAAKYLTLEADVYEDEKGPFPCWLLGTASGIGYVGPICRSKYAAKKWAKDNGYILAKEKPDGV